MTSYVIFLVGEDKSVGIVLASSEVLTLIEENLKEFLAIEVEGLQQSFDFEAIFEDFEKLTEKAPESKDLAVEVFQGLGLRPLEGFRFKCNSYEGFGTSNNYLHQILIKRVLDLAQGQYGGEKDVAESVVEPYKESAIKQKQRRNKDFIVKK